MTPGRHPIDVVPPEPQASPADLPAGLPVDVPFWRPTWREVAAHLGWRWALFLPVVGLIGVVVCVPWLPRGLWWPVVAQWKLLVWAIGGVAMATTAAVRSAIAGLDYPFCIHCGYDLTGLPDGHACPECGRPFRLATIAEYRRDPAWFVRRFRQHRSAPPMVAFDAGPVRRPRSRDGT